MSTTIIILQVFLVNCLAAPQYPAERNNSFQTSTKEYTGTTLFQTNFSKQNTGRSINYDVFPPLFRSSNNSKSTNHFTENKLKIDRNILLQSLSQGEYDKIVPTNLKKYLLGEKNFTSEDITPLFEKLNNNIMKENRKDSQFYQLELSTLQKNIEVFIQEKLNSTNDTTTMDLETTQQKGNTTHKRDLITNRNLLNNTFTPEFTNVDFKAGDKMIRRKLYSNEFLDLVSSGRLNTTLGTDLINYILENRRYDKDELQKLLVQLNGTIDKIMLEYFQSNGFRKPFNPDELRKIRNEISTQIHTDIILTQLYPRKEETNTLTELILSGKLDKVLSQEVRNYLLNLNKKYDIDELQNLQTILEDDIMKNNVKYSENMGTESNNSLQNIGKEITLTIQTNILENLLNTYQKFNKFLSSDLKKYIFNEETYEEEEVETLQTEFQGKIYEEQFIYTLNGAPLNNTEKKDFQILENTVLKIINTKQNTKTFEQKTEDIIELVQTGQLDTIVTEDIKKHLLGNADFTEQELQNMKKDLQKNLLKYSEETKNRVQHIYDILDKAILTAKNKQKPFFVTESPYELANDGILDGIFSASIQDFVLGKRLTLEELEELEMELDESVKRNNKLAEEIKLLIQDDKERRKNYSSTQTGIGVQTPITKDEDVSEDLKWLKDIITSGTYEDIIPYELTEIILNNKTSTVEDINNIQEDLAGNIPPGNTNTEIKRIQRVANILLNQMLDEKYKQTTKTNTDLSGWLRVKPT